MARWYLIHTKTRRETLAKVNLERQNYCVYHPCVLQTARVRSRWADRVTSLFPRYLFLRIEVGRQAMGPVQSTQGVAGIVRFGNDYGVVPDAVIEMLRVRADPETGLHRLSSPAPFVPGASVRIIAGAFDGLEGVFQRESGTERVIVLLRLLGQETPVRVPTSCVMPRLSHCG